MFVFTLKNGNNAHLYPMHRHGFITKGSVKTIDSQNLNLNKEALWNGGQKTFTLPFIKKQKLARKTMNCITFKRQ